MVDVFVWIVFVFSFAPMAMTILALYLFMFTSELERGYFNYTGKDGMVFIGGPALFFLSGTYLFGL